VQLFELNFSFLFPGSANENVLVAGSHFLSHFRYSFSNPSDYATRGGLTTQFSYATVTV
jgi:hypothetical protein